MRAISRARASLRRLLLCMLLAASACVRSLPPLPLPPAVADEADRYPVSGTLTFLQRKLRFGPYELRGTPGATRRSDQGATMSNGQRETIVIEQEGRFEMQGPTGRYRVKCTRRSTEVRQHEKSLQTGGGRGFDVADRVTDTRESGSARCTIASEAGETWKLERSGRGGQLTRAGASFAIAHAYAFHDEDSLVSGIQDGFSFDAGEQALAVVGTAPEVTVTLHREAPPVLAAACGALLLLRSMEQ